MERPGRSSRGLWTVGHGAGSLEDLVALLRAGGVRRVVDVRVAPGSRRHPHFGRDALAASLPAVDVVYEWRRDLGGFRQARADSPNTAIRNASFRGFADHMDTPAFLDALAWLESTSAETPTAIMCAESVWWGCHRRMIGDALVVRGWDVVHLLPGGRTQPHALHPDARVEVGRLIYDGRQRTLDLAPP